jgi:CPA2 family monovalent cation:H+ antiporter-2
MALAPFLVKLSLPLANTMLRLPLPKWLVDGLFPLKEIEIDEMKNHIVIIGKDPAAIKLSAMACHFKLKHIAIIFDPMLAREKMERGEQVVYGDAVNDPILHKAHVESADIVVLSIGNLIPSLAIIEKIKAMNRNAFIIVRAKYVGDVEVLYKAGADQVLPEKFEIAVSLLNRLLVKKLYPAKEINRMTAHIRNIHLGEFSDRDTPATPAFFDALADVNISVITVETGSEAEGASIRELDLRKRTGVTVLAMKKSGAIVEHPVPEEVFEKENLVYILGNPEQISHASELFRVEKDSES